MTALVLAEGEPEALAATLSALVPAVVEGLVGDAVVIIRHEHAAVATMAEVAGASLAVISDDADPWGAGGRLARREWLLCLQSGDVPGEGWMRAVERFLTVAAQRGEPLGRFSRSGFGVASMRLAEHVTGIRRVRAGDLVRRDWLAARDGTRVRPLRIGARIERDDRK